MTTEARFFQIDNKRRRLCSDGWIYGQDSSGRLLVCRPRMVRCDA